MSGGAEKPLIVQNDRRVFLEVCHPCFEEARDRLLGFAELEKSPEHVHVYRLTAISLWNAAAAGLDAEGVLEFLESSSRFPVPAGLKKQVREFMGGYGRLRLIAGDDRRLLLRADEDELFTEIVGKRHLEDFFSGAPIDSRTISVLPECRGALKLALVKLGYPVEDLAGYQEGVPLQVRLREPTASGEPFALRRYQQEAVEAFHADGSSRGGSGVIVLPCGAGKTIVGLGVIEAVGCQTLILSTNITSLRQWRREILDKTDVPDEWIGEYSGEVKQIRPITLTTYQILTYRRSKQDPFVHFDIFSKARWGLIIYDEVHLLPAPVFRCTAEIQTTRRLGLTATLVREDEREAEVFSLIGPRKYDVPWRSLESEGWIANAECVEVRVGFDPGQLEAYRTATTRQRFRIASENTAKLAVLRSLADAHASDHVLVIGQYIDQLRSVASELDAPLITGKTPHATREKLYDDFRCGRTLTLVVSKVGNFAVDLPDANVAIQISGTFGSRQEEAQRLGRILRPKESGAVATFYSIVTRDTRDEEFAEKRQLFLTEQGYRYKILDADQHGGMGERGYHARGRGEGPEGLRAAECS